MLNVTVKTTTLMKVTSLSGAYKPGKLDSVSITGVISGLAAGYIFAGNALITDVDGAAETFTIDAKNKGKVGKSTLALKGKFKKNSAGQLALLSGPVSLTAKLSGAFVGQWADDGIDPTKDAKKATIHMTVDFTLNSVTYTGETAPILTGKANKGGSFKFSQK